MTTHRKDQKDEKHRWLTARDHFKKRKNRHRLTSIMKVGSDRRGGCGTGRNSADGEDRKSEAF